MPLSRPSSRSRSRSFAGSPPRNRSRSHSNSSIDRRRVRSASRSASRSPQHRRSSRHAGSRGSYRRGGGFTGANRENPNPSRVIGVFNLSKYTSERQLTDAFRKFGDMEKINLIYDRPTGQSRGFAFISFINVEDARRAKEEMGGSELDGHKLRVDYSVTKRAHSPTPGVYLGMKAGGYSGERGGGRHGGGRYNGHNSRHHFSSRFRGSSPPNRPGRFRHSSRSPRGHPDRHHRRRTPTRAQYRDLSRSRSGSPIPNY